MVFTMRRYIGFVILTVMGLYLFLNTQKWHRKQEINIKINKATYHNNKHSTIVKSPFLVVGILSKMSARGRRDSIRKTWFTSCTANPDKVKCMFVTDSLDGIEEGTRKQIESEERLNKDILFTPYKGGFVFAQRFLWMMDWFRKRYNFDYFLRIDDDYFLCIDRLLFELRFRKRNGLYWGFVHCSKDVMRIDEGWLLLSRNVANEILGKWNTTLYCHPFGGQAVGLWIQESKLEITWFWDKRLIHSITSLAKQKYLKPGICEKYLGLHGTYEDTMLEYWKQFQKDSSEKSQSYAVVDIKPFREQCAHDLVFNWRLFGPDYRFEPKPCKDNPVWSISNKSYNGRGKS